MGCHPDSIRAYGQHGSGNQRLKRMERAVPLTNHQPKLWVRQGLKRKRRCLDY